MDNLNCIFSKIEFCKDLIEIIYCLHQGHRPESVDRTTQEKHTHCWAVIGPLANTRVKVEPCDFQLVSLGVKLHLRSSASCEFESQIDQVPKTNRRDGPKVLLLWNMPCTGKVASWHMSQDSTIETVAALSPCASTVQLSSWYTLYFPSASNLGDIKMIGKSPAWSKTATLSFS